MAEEKEEQVAEQPKQKSPMLMMIVVVVVAVLVAVAAAGGISYYIFSQAGIVMELNPGKSDVVKDGKVNPVAETKILDTTMQFLRAAPLEEFDATKQDALKKQLKDALNDRLGQGSVYDVYITSFLLQ